MKRALILVLAMVSPSPLLAVPNYVNYFNWCQVGNIKTVTQGLSSSTPVMGSFPSCSVQVNLHNAGVATIYSTSTGTPLANPFVAQANGLFNFYIDTNVATEYDITVSGGTPAFPTSVTLHDVFILPAGSGAPGVTSLTGDGSLITNVASQGAVTLTLGTAPAKNFWNGAWTQPACTDLSDATLCNAASPLAVASGGTGQSTYTDGQLLIGNTVGNTLTKATLTAGSNISITNGNGSISIAATIAGLSGLTTNGLMTAASATTAQTPTGYQFIAATGNTIPAPTGTGVALTMTGDANNSDILHVNKTGGTNAFKVDKAGIITSASNAVIGGTLTATTGTFTGNVSIGGGASTSSIAMLTTSGTNSMITPNAATGYTWAFPATSGTLVPRMYQSNLAAQVSAIGDTTMTTVGVANAFYSFTGSIACEGTSASATVTLTLKYTDVSNTSQTKSTSAIDCTTLNASSVDQLTYSIIAKAGTTIKWATTIANTPTYSVSVRLMQP